MALLAPRPRPPLAAGRPLTHPHATPRPVPIANRRPPRASPNRRRGRPAPRTVAASLSPGAATTTAAEDALLAAIDGVTGRGAGGLSPAAAAAVDAAVAALEADGGGVADPASAPDVEGRWRLVFTTRPGTASPIQRAFTARDGFAVHQEIALATAAAPQRVTNVVTLGAAGVLRVEAEASTAAAPLPGFTPRRGAGLPLLGKSQTGPPADPGRRIDFAFDRAFFKFAALPFEVPYPVPFRALRSTGLGDEVKGWIDVTYLAPRGAGRGVRLSRGNKGTLFVLVRDD